MAECSRNNPEEDESMLARGDMPAFIGSKKTLKYFNRKRLQRARGSLHLRKCKPKITSVIKRVAAIGATLVVWVMTLE